MKHLKCALTILLLALLSLPSLSSGGGGDHHQGPHGNHEPFGEYIVYGPRAFFSEQGKPHLQNATFAGPSRGKHFFLKVHNGDNGGKHRVWEGRIRLNGDFICDVADLPRHDGASRPVFLRNSNTLSVEVKGQPGSYLTVTIVGYDHMPPLVTITNPADGSATDRQSTPVSGAVRDDTEVNVTVNGVPATVSGKTFSVASIPLSLGSNTITAVATDSGGNSASSSVSVYRNYLVPNVTGMAKAAAESAIAAAGLMPGNETSGYDSSVAAGNVISQNPAAGTVVPAASSVNLVISLGPPTVTVPNLTGKTQAGAVTSLATSGLYLGAVTRTNSSTVAKGRVVSQNPAANTLVGPGTAVAIVISSGPADPVIPSDPAAIAPRINGTVATTVAASTAFLYTGSNPVQTGVAAGTIESHRAALLRGKVLASNGSALPGVTITVLNHPEFGQTVSRNNGMFDLVVNGGGVLTVNYAKNGYMSAQRQTETTWNGYAVIPEIILLPYDKNVTAINLASVAPIQVARGGVTTDTRGTRQATIMFSQGTTANMVYADGTTEPLTTLNVRATEYTVGDNGPKAMPAELPPASAYTYAVELSVDEALSNGATSVQFSKPVFFYVENFLSFPVGGIVPVGYYDPDKAAWIPSDNGVIVKILSIANGMATLDTDGSGQAADAAKLAALGITDEERSQLAALYGQDQSLWRFATSHFSSWDCNWGWGPPSDANYPNQAAPSWEKGRSIKNTCKKRGSIIECQNQTLGESLPITGTPFSFNYSSSRVPGRLHENTAVIPLSGSSVPASLQTILLNISIAGRTFSHTYSPSANLSYTFTWDGLDAYGRTLSGSHTANISIGYVYGGYYGYVDRFGYNGNGQGSITGDRSTLAVTLWQNSSVDLEYKDDVVKGMGGWEFDLHHTLDINSAILHTGDGQSRDVPLLHPTSESGTITTIAGTGESASSGDGGLATQASLDTPVNVAIGPDGGVYIREANCIRKIGANGMITTIAGNGETETADSALGDGGLATATALSGGYGLAVSDDNSIFLADPVKGRIRRIGTDGIIHTFASGLTDPYAVLAPKYHDVYFTEKSQNTINCASYFGTIGTYRGCWYVPTALLHSPHGLAGDLSGFYVADSGANRILSISSQASLNYSGNGNSTYNGDFGSASGVSLNSPEGVTIGPDRRIYIADTLNNRIRRVDRNYNLITIAGSGDQGYNGDGMSALSAALNKPTGLAVAGDGSVYIADSANNRVRRVSFVSTTSQDYLVAAEDGSEVYVFDSTGRHLRTIHPLTGATLYQFGYNANGLLTSITDGSGNVTAIERDASGNPTAIVAPFGQRTTIMLDPNGYIASVTNPAGETTSMTYATGGLLASLADPRGNASQFTYDSRGFLTRDQDAAGGFWSLAQIELSKSSQVTMSSALGRSTTYLTEQPDDSYQIRTIASPTGSQTTQYIYSDGAEKVTGEDSTATNITKSPDPRFAMQSPLVSLTITTPGGRSLALKSQRSISLSVPGSTLSKLDQTDSTIVNNRTYTTYFDGVLNKLTMTSPEGRTAASLINSLGKPLSITLDSSLTPFTFSYDSYGRLAQAAHGDQVAAYSYDSSGRVAGIADALGNTSQFGYDQADRVKLVTLPSGRTYGFSYDANGNRTGITMPSGAGHSLGYTVVNLGSDYTPPSNTSYTWQYSLDKEWLRTLLPGGRTVQAAYDSGGRSLGTVYPEATVSLNYSDTTRRIGYGIRSPADGNASQVTSFTYDGPLVTGLEQSGVASGKFAYTYDNNFRISRIDFTSGSDSITTAITRDKDGLITAYGPFTFTREGPAGATSRINDTVSLRTTTQLQNDGSMTLFAYSDSTDTPRDFRSGKNGYRKAPLYSLLAKKNIASALFEQLDSVNRTELLKSSAPKPGIPMLAVNTCSPSFDMLAAVPATTVPNVVGMTEADAEAAILEANLLVGSVTTQASETVPSGVVISQSPEGGTMIGMGSGVGIIVSSGSFITTPNVVGMTQTNAEAAILAANLVLGKVTTAHSNTVAAGVVISQSPDAGTKLSSGSSIDITVSSGSMATIPNVVGMTQANAQAAILSANLTLGTITTTITNAVQPGAVISQSPAAGSAVEPNTPVSLVVCSANLGLDINITRDSLGRISSRTHTVSGIDIYSIQLAYDSRGNVSQKTETIAGTTTTRGYTYDADSQLTSATKNGTTEETYTYDVNGNRTAYQRPATTVTSTFDSQDRVSQSNGLSYTFNADGQMTQRGADSFSYSAMGELIQATVSGQTISYAYDALHRRIARTDATGTSQYLYGNLQNPFQLTAMRDTSGVLTYYYYDDTGMLFAFDKGGVRYYVATDQIGSPKVVTDASGSVVKQLEFDSYGDFTFDANPDFDLPIGFAGGLADRQTRLVRFGYRDYEPDTGRWTAKDPIFFAGGLNLYQYVQNNPVNRIDLNGLDWSDVPGAVYNAITGGTQATINMAVNGPPAAQGALGLAAITGVAPLVVASAPEELGSYVLFNISEIATGVTEWARGQVDMPGAPSKIDVAKDVAKFIKKAARFDCSSDETNRTRPVFNNYHTSRSLSDLTYSAVISRVFSIG